MSIRGYDAWLFSGFGESDAVGAEEGETCNRIAEPDEDAPRGYNPKPCSGEMMEVHDSNTSETWIECDKCGETTQ